MNKSHLPSITLDVVEHMAAVVLFNDFLTLDHSLWSEYGVAYRIFV